MLTYPSCCLSRSHLGRAIARSFSNVSKRSTFPKSKRFQKV
ncbi:hypothetical protein CKA32_001519 [Geitlerinema sp. FC II]|nr:hypothetical protein CKA32_001519 [Geitlerinema sp. FC II]